MSDKGYTTFGSISRSNSYSSQDPTEIKNVAKVETPKVENDSGFSFGDFFGSVIKVVSNFKFDFSFPSWMSGIKSFCLWNNDDVSARANHEVERNSVSTAAPVLFNEGAETKIKKLIAAGEKQVWSVGISDASIDKLITEGDEMLKTVGEGTATFWGTSESNLKSVVTNLKTAKTSKGFLSYFPRRMAVNKSKAQYERTGALIESVKKEQELIV